MSKLDELINQLCPDGVEFVQLWEVTIWDKRFNSVDRKKQPQIVTYPYLLAADLFKLEQPSGAVFLLSTGEQTGWTTEELAADYLCDGEVVCIPWGKSRPVKEVLKYYKGKFVTADNRIATSNDTSKLLNKYLYYWMLNSGEMIDRFYRGSGIKHPSMNDVLNMEIPLPPLPVQEEIVRILDNFTELTAELTEELTEELTARKKQYEYYRDRLLAFGNEVEWKPLSGFCDIGDGLHGTPKYDDSGEYYFVNGNNLSNGKITFDSKTKKVNVGEYARLKIDFSVNTILMSINGTIGNIAIYNGEKVVLGKSAAYFSIFSEFLNLKFLYYYLQATSTKNYFINNLTGSTIKNLGLKTLRNFKIPIPSVPEQQCIVDILDRFDTLCNDISNGLPAEIKARQQQYEYYRNKLLAFPKAELEV